MLKKWFSALLSASMLISGIGLPVLANEEFDVEEMEDTIQEMSNEETEEIDEKPIEEASQEIVFPEAGEIVHRGTIGTAEWTLDDNGILTIGEGELENITNQSLLPSWESIRSKIKGVNGKAKFIAKGDLGQTFLGLINSTSIDLSGWDTSEVTYMGEMFKDCQALTSINVSNWDTSSVWEMTGVFENCKSLKTLNLSNWDTSSVMYMSWMFKDCQALTSLDVSGWDTSSMVSMSQMFYNCKSLKSLDVSNWDTSSVSDMNEMFYNCQVLKSLDVSNWKTPHVYYMQSMFENCNTLESLDVSNWNPGFLKEINKMFKNCQALTSLDLSTWNVRYVTDMEELFLNCLSLESLDLSNWNVDPQCKTLKIFNDCDNLFEINYGNNNDGFEEKIIKLIPNNLEWYQNGEGPYRVSELPSLSKGQKATLIREDHFSEAESDYLLKLSTNSIKIDDIDSTFILEIQVIKNGEVLPIVGFSSLQPTPDEVSSSDLAIEIDNSENLKIIKETNTKENKFIIKCIPIASSKGNLTFKIEKLSLKITIPYLINGQLNENPDVVSTLYTLPNFDLALDTFSFTNNIENFYNSPKKNQKFNMNEETLVALAKEKDFGNSDIQIFKKQNKKKWEGVCAGLVTAMMENYKNCFPLTSDNKGPLSQLNPYLPKDNSELFNELTFRQFIQYSKASRTKQTEFIHNSTKENRLEQLVSLLKEIKKSEQPIGIDYTCKQGTSSDLLTHRVLAYKMEEIIEENTAFNQKGEKVFLESQDPKSFKYKIYIADPNTYNDPNASYLLISRDFQSAILKIKGYESKNTYDYLPLEFSKGQSYNGFFKNKFFSDFTFTFENFHLNLRDIYYPKTSSFIIIQEQENFSTYEKSSIFNESQLASQENQFTIINKDLPSFSYSEEDGSLVTVIDNPNNQAIQLTLASDKTSFRYQDKYITANCLGNETHLIFSPDGITIDGDVPVDLEITKDTPYISNTEFCTMKIKASGTEGETKINFDNGTIEMPDSSKNMTIELTDILDEKTSKKEIANGVETVSFNDLDNSNPKPTPQPVTPSGNTSSHNQTPIIPKNEMYRLYNPNSGEHFYTADQVEKDHLTSIGWNYEGVGWTAPKTSKTPVYRLYNENAGDHHYTTDSNEKDTLVRIGWKDEKIGWYSDDKKGVPLYRVYNPNAQTGAHHYTTDKTEQAYLVSIGWNPEGIAWYGLK